MMPYTIEKFLTVLRETNSTFDYVYRNGCCFELFRLLRELEPDAVAWYSAMEGHVYTQIGDRFYDIRGESKLPPDAYEMTKEHRLYTEAFTWKESLFLDVTHY